MSFRVGVVFSTLAILAGAGQAFGVTISSFYPPLGSGGDQVTINGSGFYPGTLIVRFNGVQDTNAYASAADGTIILSRVPYNAPLGAGRISVTVNGNSASSLQDFTVIGPGPYITNFNPVAGSPGTTVFIDGVHFTNPDSTPSATNAYFNGKAGANFFAQSDIRILVDAPAGVTTGPISVRSRLGTNTTSTNFFASPVITGFSPTTGRAGTNVLVTGTNFLGTFAMAFGGINTSTFTVLSNNAILVTVPAGALTGPVRVDGQGRLRAVDPPKHDCDGRRQSAE